MRLLEIPDALRDFGLEPILVDGWETRGYEFPTRPGGYLEHWTAGGSAPDASLWIVTYGRPPPNPLPGPLCEVHQSRRVAPNGLNYINVVASGKANHAGEGDWHGLDSNYDLIGNEIEWSGPTEVFGTHRHETADRVAAAMTSITAAPNPQLVALHREYALPPGRKVDTNRNGDALRNRVAALLAPAPPLPEQEEDMLIVHPTSTATYWLLYEGKLLYLPTTTDIRAHQEAGVKTAHVSDRMWDIYTKTYTKVAG